MTRKQIQDQITLNMNDARTNTVTQILNCMDIVLRYMVTKLQITGSIHDGFIRTTSGRMQYPLASEARQLQGDFYIPESNTALRSVSPDIFNRDNPDPDDTDIPAVYMLQERYPVKQQPHSKLRLVSDSASDTQAVTIHGESYGRYISEAVTLTGTTAVLTSSEYNENYRFVAATAAVGTITITANSTSGNTALPTVATAGDVTVGTIAAAATESADVINPGALLRIELDADVAGDRSKSVRVEGIAIDTTNSLDRVERVETLTTDGSNATTSVVSSTRWTEIRNISKGWDSTGTLLVMTDPGDLVVSEIGPRRRSVEYQQVRFYNVPDGKAIKYRYTPGHISLNNDNDIPDIPEVYHQVVAEWTEKLVRGIHGDTKLGIATLENNQQFDRAVREIRMSSTPATSERIRVGSRWQQRQRKFLDFPITHSTN